MWRFPPANATRNRSTQPRADLDGGRLSRCSLPGLPSPALQERGGRDNRNAAERVYGKQIGVAAHNQIRSAADSDFQEFIVLRITAGGNPLGNGHQFSRVQ